MGDLVQFPDRRADEPDKPMPCATCDNRGADFIEASHTCPDCGAWFFPFDDAPTLGADQ